MTEIPQIDVKDIAMFTIHQKIKQTICNKFYKLDEDFDLEKFLGKEMCDKLSEKDFQNMEEKIISEWRSLDERDTGQIQLNLLSKLRTVFPPPIYHKRFGKIG